MADDLLFEVVRESVDDHIYTDLWAWAGVYDHPSKALMSEIKRLTSAEDIDPVYIESLEDKLTYRLYRLFYQTIVRIFIKDLLFRVLYPYRLLRARLAKIRRALRS